MAEKVPYLNFWSPWYPSKIPTPFQQNGNEGGGHPTKIPLPLQQNGSKKRGREEVEELSTELKLFTDPWKVKKKLTKSDVDGSSRLLLSMADVRAHILPHLGERFDAKRGGSVRIWDNDTETEHVLQLKQWNTNSYVLINNWRKEFKNRRGLEKGDEIGLFWNRFSSSFYFGLLRKNQKWNS